MIWSLLQGLFCKDAENNDKRGAVKAPLLMWRRNMQIIDGAVIRDITGEIVYLEKYKDKLAKVLSFSTDRNKAVVKLCDGGVW